MICILLCLSASYYLTGHRWGWILFRRWANISCYCTPLPISCYVSLLSSSGWLFSSPIMHLFIFLLPLLCLTLFPPCFLLLTQSHFSVCSSTTCVCGPLTVVSVYTGTVSSCSPDCRLLWHSEAGWLIASPADPTSETTFNQSTLSSTVGRDNQREQHRMQTWRGRGDGRRVGKQQELKHLREGRNREEITKEENEKTGRECHLAR